MFKLLFAIAVLLPLIGFLTFWLDARSRGWIWISSDSVKMYVDTAKTFLTASGVAVAIVVASLGGKFSPPMWIVQRAVAGLVACVVFSPVSVLVLYRCFERAAARYRDDGEEPHEIEQGKLTKGELAIILMFGYVAVEGFVLGFLYLARIPFWL